MSTIAIAFIAESHMAYVINKRPTKKGLAFDLYFRWKGVRYRPLLGYNLTKAQADEAAIVMIAKIQQGAIADTPSPASITFKGFLPLYWQTMRVKKRFDLARPESIIETHLLPRFGERQLDSLTAEDGLAYVTARLRAKAAPWTIRREWNVLMRILNLAVDFDKLDKNRLKRVELPDAQTRERVATIEELKSIKGKADERRLKVMNAIQYDPAELWRIVTVALNTGLREAKILEIDRTWLRKRDDGWWLILPPARSKLKQTPREIPLNPAAYAALHGAIAHVDGRISSDDGLPPRSASSGNVWQRKRRWLISTFMTCATRSPRGFRISAFRSKYVRPCWGIGYEEWDTINLGDSP